MMIVFSSVAGLVTLLWWLTPPQSASAQTDNPTQTYLPVVTNDAAPLARRMGYGVTTNELTRYPELDSLRAGWYLDWGVTIAPLRPRNIEYVQVVRVHQKLSCGVWHHSDRTVCPYAQPLTYVFAPTTTVIISAAQQNPGALWLIGNEMDRKDWAYCVRFRGDFCEEVAYSGQDEMLPATYATAFHDLAALIRSADPTARIAIGGVIQATPLRLAYLTEVWDSYLAQYGETMAVDVWNVHNFILQERRNNYGADIPPGSNATEGAYLDNTLTHVDLVIFAEQIRAFRQWMKARGQQEKPLIISEYGVLYHNYAMGYNDNDPTGVLNFLDGTMNYLLNAKDCSLGYTVDECRLVQRWNWYSLDDVPDDFNPFSRLFDPTTLAITPAGERFRTFTQANHSLLSRRGYD
jgi:hypothetical protein